MRSLLIKYSDNMNGVILGSVRDWRGGSVHGLYNISNRSGAVQNCHSRLSCAIP